MLQTPLEIAEFDKLRTRLEFAESNMLQTLLELSYFGKIMPWLSGKVVVEDRGVRQECGLDIESAWAAESDCRLTRGLRRSPMLSSPETAKGLHLVIVCVKSRFSLFAESACYVRSGYGVRDDFRLTLSV
ncbi:hypothetical protein KSP39_PZI022636 [Platanthera zijinensis]|uniref:Uncharacterized protein n=1 Tax=Platanthera zijinensis TaxID=2320716 RepID=A0AAP0AVR8_9ASPA